MYMAKNYIPCFKYKRNKNEKILAFFIVSLRNICNYFLSRMTNARIIIILLFTLSNNLFAFTFRFSVHLKHFFEETC